VRHPHSNFIEGKHDPLDLFGVRLAVVNDKPAAFYRPLNAYGPEADDDRARHIVGKFAPAF
jgi:hypothetical protein